MAAPPVTTSLSEAPDLDGVQRAAPGEQLALHRGGSVVGSAPSDTADYAELRRLVVQAGLLERQPLYYALKFVSIGLMLAVGIALQLRAAYLPWWVQVLNVVFLAFVFGQIGLLGHHVAH